jgi:hypothetical protein
VPAPSPPQMRTVSPASAASREAEPVCSGGPASRFFTGRLKDQATTCPRAAIPAGSPASRPRIPVPDSCRRHLGAACPSAPTAPEMAWAPERRAYYRGPRSQDGPLPFFPNSVKPAGQSAFHTPAKPARSGPVAGPSDGTAEPDTRLGEESGELR